MSKKKLMFESDNNLLNISMNLTREKPESKRVGDKGLERGLTQVDIDKLEPAPPEWNFFSKLSPEMYEDLKESIRKNGLNHPIIVYKKNEKEFMILSGHNRVNIYKELMEEDPYRFKSIPAIVESPDTMNELDIREKIIDMNVLSRKLSAMDISKSIYHKWIIQKERMNRGDGTTSVNVGEQLNLSARHVNRYKSLFHLIDELQNMVETELIGVNNGSKLATLDKEMQKWLYDNYKDRLTHSKIKQIHAGMSKVEIELIFSGVKEKKYTAKYEVPSHLKKEFDEYVKSWLLSKGVSKKN